MKSFLNSNPKGTYDIVEQESEIFLKIRNIFFQYARKFNFSYIETPIFEYAEIFEKTSQDSDVVTKELYKFLDKSNRQLALRPEGTAPIMRAIWQHKLHQVEKKFFYFGPMFRYEKPQKGRFRQFYQAGFEITNYKSQSFSLQILEVILLVIKILENLKIQNYQLKINYLSNSQTRQEYSRALTQYFEKYIDKLEPISKSRLKNNPLRILDDKIESSKDFVKSAPKISDFWSVDDKENFNSIISIFEKFKINYVIDYSLVRGLDYYDEFVFEFIDNDKILGSKLTFAGGGCYNNLPRKFGMANFKSIGVAFGIERLIEIFKSNSPTKLTNLDFYLIGFSQDEILKNFELAILLREQNFQVDLNKSPLSIKDGFQKAKKSGAKFAFFFEKDEQPGQISIKNLQTSINKVISLLNIDFEFLRTIIDGETHV